MVLVEEVLAAIGSRRPVLDLFAELGTFARALARGGPVHAVEGDARSAGRRQGRKEALGLWAEA